jgi:hypothetical protein
MKDGGSWLSPLLSRSRLINEKMKKAKEMPSADQCPQVI